MVKINDKDVRNTYVNATLARRKKMCKTIIDESLVLMNVNADRKIKLELICVVLNRSLSFYENQQMYEDCIMYRDLINTIKSEYISIDNEEISL